MKVSEQWLREWVDAPESTLALCDQLTGAGLEVEDVSAVAPPLDNVVVAEVMSAGPHPQADRLKLCTVSAGAAADGAQEPLQIVCGAPNVHAGMKAALALVGANLPGGLKIRRSKIRGEASSGMLCSSVELGLGEDSDGIIELAADAPVGTPLAEYLALDDNSIDIGLTPNRGDCLGVIGLARDLATVNSVPLTGPAMEPVPAVSTERVDIALEAPHECPYFVGRIVRGVNAAAPTPVWMRERLRRSGVRGISVVVDITNYVMLELGQPMHAFDFAKVDGGVRVRKARAGERLELLDGTELELDDELVVIADHQKPMALAGIMGGSQTGVTAATTDVLFECAYFNPRTIAAEARRLGLHTDASHRFERAVNSDGQRRAIERATSLLIEIAGGEAGETVEARDEAYMPLAKDIRLRSSRIVRLLGYPVGHEDVTGILQRLGMAVEEDVPETGGPVWRVRPPSFRADVTMEADLIEELARIVGYDSIPVEPPGTALEMRADHEGDCGPRGFQSILVERGYQEAVTYSFVSMERQGELDPAREPIPLANPISADMGVMRTSLWPGLVDALVHNLNRQQLRVRLFELGLVFRRDAPGAAGGDSGVADSGGRDSPLAGIAQPEMLAGIVSGPAIPEQWGDARRPADFYDLKSDVEALLAAGARAGDYVFEVTSHPALHSGQCAAILREGRPVGLMGMLHPRLARVHKLANPAFLFEVDLREISKGRVPAYVPQSRFPTVRRDISVIVDEQVSADSIRNAVGQAGSDVLKNLELFDVFRGKGIDSGRKSLSLALTFQHPERTMKDAEVDALVEAAVDALRSRFRAELRGA